MTRRAAAVGIALAAIVVALIAAVLSTDPWSPFAQRPDQAAPTMSRTLDLDDALGRTHTVPSSPTSPAPAPAPVAERPATSPDVVEHQADVPVSPPARPAAPAPAGTGGTVADQADDVAVIVEDEPTGSETDPCFRQDPESYEPGGPCYDGGGEQSDEERIGGYRCEDPAQVIVAVNPDRCGDPSELGR